MITSSTPTRRSNKSRVSYTNVMPDLGPNVLSSAGFDASHTQGPLIGMRRVASPLTPYQTTTRTKRRTLGQPPSLQQEQFLDEAWTKLIAPYVTAGLDVKAEELEACIDFANLERQLEA